MNNINELSVVQKEKLIESLSTFRKESMGFAGWDYGCDDTMQCDMLMTTTTTHVSVIRTRRWSLAYITIRNPRGINGNIGRE